VGRGGVFLRDFSLLRFPPPTHTALFFPLEGDFGECGFFFQEVFSLASSGVGLGGGGGLCVRSFLCSPRPLHRRRTSHFSYDRSFPAPENLFSLWGYIPVLRGPFFPSCFRRRFFLFSFRRNFHLIVSFHRQPLPPFNSPPSPVTLSSRIPLVTLSQEVSPMG